MANISQINPSDNGRLERILKAHGIYPTSQRMAIAKVLLSRHQPVTAEQVHERLHRDGAKISKATVYNTLGLFVDKQLLREIFVDPSRVYYDSNNSHHHHFYNMDTGEMTDIHEDLAPQIHTAELPQGTVLEDFDIVIRVRNQAH